ncbi:hypothetical protein N5D61_25445 [Pseudomonas sp. GD03842]|uniref:hypothetical protein n=1 Tax=unclassified Pseudomonas TaxID=196821 RepID=UPI000D35414B|nr:MULTISPECIES: hypothetical protein [unclassified Pseudomonas]MDH0749676.1 hypothetical protein [Pseudomonas sp. GD03842]RAU49498.1 hypothetical protein DBP26_001420 [Pseudomonas sp. RIT 409]RAU55763.1 hypothetical protein DBY65_001100 [Pseudomonas sp. RIT 412]
MKARSVLLALSFVLLSGCLVTFNDPIPTRDTAPPRLLGTWTSKNAWGEPLELEITRAGADQYKAVSYRKGDRKNRDEYAFTVSRHGSRWYVSAALPEKYGGHYVIAGFDLIDNDNAADELVIYDLDLERVQQLVDQKVFEGRPTETEKGDGVLITTPLDNVFAYLDDSANSDIFLSAAKYQRMAK